jgi:enoyl-[acyl-carrier protein] reductase/trans-2-enoyl-CoA reductase (NAD+)
MWMDALKAENLLSGATTVAYSYIGPSLTEAVYRKEQLVVLKMIWKLLLSPSDSLADINGLCFCKQSFSNTNKFSYTCNSLYISLLYKIMKEQGIHEGCIEQIQRLYAERLFSGKAIATDEKRKNSY